ncbi:SsrA-binding protein [Patescibacteria group bacterium]|nr:SsrA-binding protein [Patescibacteria group bacterium]
MLYGHEVKAIKTGQIDLFGSHVRIIGDEAYSIGARIYTYKFAKPERYDEKRTRKLLLRLALERFYL